MATGWHKQTGPRSAVQAVDSRQETCNFCCLCPATPDYNNNIASDNNILRGEMKMIKIAEPFKRVCRRLDPFVGSRVATLSFYCFRDISSRTSHTAPKVPTQKQSPFAHLGSTGRLLPQNTNMLLQKIWPFDWLKEFRTTQGCHIRGGTVFFDSIIICLP